MPSLRGDHAHRPLMGVCLVRCLLAGAAAAACLTCSASALGYGMGVHYGTYPSDLRQRMAMQVAAGGAGYVRTDFYRCRVLREDGTLDLSVYDACVADSEAAGLRVLPILRDKVKADSAILDDIDGWIRYVEEFTRHFGRRHFPVIEVWNEPNISHFWTDGDAKSYLRLLKATTAAIRRIDPSIRVALGGVAGVPFGFLRSIYEQGGRDWFDVMNVHPYTHPQRPEEQLISKIRDLRALMAEFGDGDKSIWFTEIGWPTHKMGFTGGHLLKAGLKFAQAGRTAWRVALADNVEPVTESMRTLGVSMAEILPTGSRVEAVGPAELNRRLASDDFDLVVYPFDESYPCDTFQSVKAFVERGGVLADFGGVPIFKARRAAPDGSLVRVNENGEFKGWQQLRVEYSACWLDPALPEGSNVMFPTDAAIAAGVKDDPNGYGTIRYLTDALLHPGDEMIPLLKGKDLRGKECVSAAVYKYADWKGAVILCANNSSKLHVHMSNDEATQAAYVVRAYALAFACGIESVCVYEYLAPEADPYYSEHHFGIVHHDHTEKPAYGAYRAFAEMRPAASREIHAAWRFGDVYAPQWVRPDATVGGMLWTTSADVREMSVEFFGDGVEFFDMHGKPLAVKRPSPCLAILRLSGDPVYFMGARIASVAGAK